MIILFDIGGTTTRIAKSMDGKTLDLEPTNSPNSLISIVRYPTPQNYHDGLQALQANIAVLADGHTIDRIAGGCAGAFNKNNSRFYHSHNLKDWSNKPLSEDLSSAFKCPVKIRNDASVAALGEAHFGIGKNFESFIYLTIGTGLGGSWVKHKQLVANKFNTEPGHQIINYETGQNLESISGMGLTEQFGRPVSELSDDELWNAIKTRLVTGLYNTFLHWPSDAIILGGGVLINRNNLHLEELQTLLDEKLSYVHDTPKILHSTLGDNTTLYGAIYL